MALNFLSNATFAGSIEGTSATLDSLSAFPTLTLARSTAHSGISFTLGVSNFSGAGADLLFDSGGNSTGFGFRTRDSSGNQQTALVIGPDGNVGVGVAVPLQPLHVIGAGLFTENVTSNTRFEINSVGVGIIGAISNTANDLNIFSTSSGHNGLRFHVSGILPTNNAGTIVDADANLGEANYRFKDGYFSGTVTATNFIGGSGAFLPLAGGTMLGDIQFNEHSAKFNQSGVRSWEIVASSGKLNILSGDSVGVVRISSGLEVDDNITIDSALLSNQENTDIDSAAAEMVAQVAIATYTAAFFDFVVKKSTNVRSGTVYACHDGTSVQFTETSTQDLGDTSDVVLSVDISGTQMRLIATVASDDWSVKSLIRAI